MNGHAPTPTSLRRAEEVGDLIDTVKSLIIPFIRTADEAAPSKTDGGTSVAASVQNSLVESREPLDLVARLAFSLPERDGLGQEGLLETIQQILRYSVNTWDQGFLDKLYGSTNAVHVYQVSPALTVIEKTTARNLARLFGFTGPRAGGATMMGGSASNMTSIVIARNHLFPSTKADGNGSHRFALFTSAHGHYSVEKAAQACGMGSGAVWPVAVDAASGRMIPSSLSEQIERAKAAGRTPLYVNATAGTTVFGSFDPFEEIGEICRRHGLWMHVDASWGGSVVFSRAQRHKLAGAHLADSLTVNPHKMMNVPVTCSFLLGRDMRVFHEANTLRAGYLFHRDRDANDDEKDKEEEEEWNEVWDLADLTMQCGRRGDSLKLALSWIYHGPAGFERQIDGAFGVVAHLAGLIDAHGDFVLLSANPPPCLQVCFYYVPNNSGGGWSGGLDAVKAVGVKENTRRTSQMVAKLIRRGFMIDYAPGDDGHFFRVVVNLQTLRTTVEGLVKALEEAGKEVVQ